MAYSPLLPLLCILVLFHGCLAQIERQQQFLWQNLQRQQQHRLRAKSDCRVNRLTAQEPTQRFEYEAGVTEYWDETNQPFYCAGVAAVRNTIQPRGLLLPHYNNAPQILYVVQGRGLQGTVIPGCAETYETGMRIREGESQRFIDRHQKVRQFREGDVLALPAGATLWFYNNGEVPVVTIALLDLSNDDNQLDRYFRNFFLAGNEQAADVSYYRQGKYQEGARGERGQRSNIFNGFDEEILQEVFNVDRETARRLQGQYESRGRIVRAENFHAFSPRYEEEEKERYGYEGPYGYGGKANGLEETFCAMRLRENLAHPTRADVYNPRGGRLSTLNSQKLPILRTLRLSAERGVLYRNAVMAPHWNMNSHSMIYVIRGNARLQAVGHQGRLVLDEEVREGQLVIVPQNFVVVKKASDRGFEWVALKTNDNAMTTPLAGRLSVFRAMPEEVLMSSYRISRQDARNLKYNREELTLFTPRYSYSKSTSPRANMMESVLKAIETVV